MKKLIDTKNEIATSEGFDNWEQMRKQFILNGLHGTIAAYERKAEKLYNNLHLHKCKYCGVETTQPDEECYKATTS